jgi:uncharacterized protein
MSSRLTVIFLRPLVLALTLLPAPSLWADEVGPESAQPIRPPSADAAPALLDTPVDTPPPSPGVGVLPSGGIADIPLAETVTPTPAPAPDAAGPRVETGSAPRASVAEPTATEVEAAAPSDAQLPSVVDAADAAPTAEGLDPTPTPVTVTPFRLLESEIPPGTLRRVAWYPPDSFSGLSEPTPILVAHGAKAGPVLCLTAAIHGDELNGIEMVRRVVYDLDPQELSGTLIGVPIVNLQGFRQGSRYLMDRRDLNRHFPGHRRGSAASRIAHSLFSQIIVHCNALVDLHTGSFHRTNLPQVRGDLRIESVAHLTKGFGATSVLNGGGPTGSLRRAATDIGIPAVTLEAGEPLRFQPEEVDHGVRALRSLLNYLEMVPRFRRWGEPQPVYYESQWVRANEGGILVSSVTLGAVVRKGQLLGTVTDPITNRRLDVRAPFDGRVLGMALNQSVIPGFAAYHIGIRRSESELTETSAAVDEDGNPLPEAVTGLPVLTPETLNGTETPMPPEDPESAMDPDRLTDG